MDAQFAVHALQFGAGLVMAITALELLVRPAAYARKGILSWDLVRRNPRVYHRPFRRRMGDFFYAEKRFQFLIGIRLLLGLGMATSACLSWLSPVLIGAALLSSLLILYRADPGLDGSFQLRILILFVLLNCAICPWDTLAFRMGLYFLSAQLVLSYLLAGIAKLRGQSWRKGAALIGIMGTLYHGLPWAHRFLAKRKGLSKVLSWTVIAFELLFPLVLTGQAELVFGFLVFTTLFHLLSSLLMGLNGFFLSFTAAYPALIYCLGHLAWAGW